MAGTSGKVGVAFGLVVVLVAAGLTASFVVSAMGKRESVRTGAETTGTLASLEETSSPLEGTAVPSDLGASQQRQPTQLGKFDAQAAMKDIRALAAIGPRGAGSPGEVQGAEYLRGRLAGMGLDAQIEEFPLPNGLTSRNVVARIEGSSDSVIVLGAHMDTKPPSPGGNDDATGCAALLQIAEVISREPVVPTVEIVFFGSEETSGGDPNGHHFGSRYRVSQMSGEERATTAGMISVDMIGYGTALHSRTMGKGPSTLSDLVLARASALGIPMTYKQDPGKSGWSDHEAYELAGIPVSWVEWRDDPVYHSAGDDADHLQVDRIDSAGRLVLEVMRSLSASDLDALTAR